jgi:hypothetical protein
MDALIVLIAILGVLVMFDVASARGAGRAA